MLKCDFLPLKIFNSYSTGRIRLREILPVFSPIINSHELRDSRINEIFQFFKAVDMLRDSND